MRLSDLVASLAAAGNTYSTQVPDSWAQGRSLFGGLQGALMLRAMRHALGSDTPLRTLQVTFMAPVAAGEVRVSAQVLRAGKSATHVEARIYERETLGAIAIGVFGVARESAVVQELACPSADKTSEKSFEQPFIPGLTPAFLQHTQVRWAHGGLPYSGTRSPSVQLYLRFRDEPVVDEGVILGLADIIPPIGLSYLKKPAAGSSMTWTLDFLRHDWPREGGDYWRVDAELLSGREGYSSQTITLFAPDGKAVALSRQAMVVFG